MQYQRHSQTLWEPGKIRSRLEQSSLLSIHTPVIESDYQQRTIPYIHYPDIPGSSKPGDTSDQVKPIRLLLQEICKKEKKKISQTKVGTRDPKIILRTDGYFLSCSYY